MLYQYTIYPIECAYKIIYLSFAELLDHYGLALIALSILTSLIIRPFMRWAAKLQAEEKRLQDIMKPQIDAIKAESSGAEQYQRIQRMYKRYGYHPVMAIRSAIGVMLQIPFLMAAFYMLSKLPEIQGFPWGFIKNLGGPDKLFFGIINILPFIMTAVNLLGAYTTKGFSKKDKKQAFVIAVLFLILLYKAPSALLIYWTCNNLWTLLGNVKRIIVERYGLVLPSFTIKGKGVMEWLAGAPAALYVFLAFAFTVCVLVPADVFLVNSGELWFTLTQILKYLLLGTIVLFIILSVIYYIIPNHSCRAVLTALVLGLLLAVWLQSYVINLDYGILDGRTIQWDSFKNEAILNCLAWVLCILAPLFGLYYFKAAKFAGLAKKAAILLVIIQLCSALYVAGSSSNQQSKKPDNAILTTEGEFTVSSNENIIVFILDAFESKTFREVQEKNPDLVKELNGFTYYPDAESFYGYTDYSLPQILTNKVFENQGSYKYYLKEAWKNNPFFTFLKNKNYDIRIYSLSSFVYSSEGAIDNLTTTKYIVDKNTMNSFIKLTLFRELPHLLKKSYVIYSGDLRNPVAENKKVKPYIENDVAFYNELKKGLQVRNDKNCFRFYHLNGAHFPYTMNANVERLAKGVQGTQYEQAVGSLKIVLNYINQLKKNHIFDTTTFAILADHGKHNGIVTGPLVLIKQPHAEDIPLITKNNAISFSGLHATLLQRYGSEASRFGTDFSRANEKERFFYVIKNEQNRDISLIKYKLTGNIEDENAWKRVGILKSAIDNSDNSYELGEKIEFSQFGTSAKYTRSGWSRSIREHRWMKAPAAVCAFTVNNYKKGNLTLHVWGRPNLPDKAKSCEITIYVGKQKVGAWKATTTKTKSYKVVIPGKLIKKNRFEIKFKIEKPVKPVDKQFLVTSMQIDEK